MESLFKLFNMWFAHALSHVIVLVERYPIPIRLYFYSHSANQVERNEINWAVKFNAYLQMIGSSIPFIIYYISYIIPLSPVLFRTTIA